MAFEDMNDGYKEKVVGVSRTAKVVKGGRVFKFSVKMVVGDGKGRVGFGSGKGREVPIAIQKAIEQAKKNMVSIQLAGKTIHSEMVSDFGASKVFMKPASPGTGVIAGGAMRAVFEVLGIEDILAKSIGSTNPSNVVRATIAALTNMSTPEYIAAKRGKAVEQILEEQE